jgi:hypothetical protein
MQVGISIECVVRLEVVFQIVVTGVSQAYARPTGRPRVGWTANALHGPWLDHAIEGTRCAGQTRVDGSEPEPSQVSPRWAIRALCQTRHITIHTPMAKTTI